MKIHEYQGKEILKKYGVPVPNGKVAFTREEAIEAAKEIGGESGKVVVKAQIHAGGRGKGGGVKLAGNHEEAVKHIDDILGMTLVTHQTGPEGRVVKRLLLEEVGDIKKEYYFGIVLDRETSRITIMASTEGGMDIEEVAEKTPEKILKVTVHPSVGVQPYQIRNLVYGLGLPKAAHKDAHKLIAGCYNAYIKEDASLLEINPLVLTGDDHLVALDAKVNFDENASFRHPSYEELRDLDEEDPAELEASKFGLNFIKLDGNIGCLVNGAGLAMATMDIIKHHGGEPANFLDVGGGASQEAVTEAFKIILKDEGVKGIFVNIFGGIMKCDIIAGAVIGAAKEVGIEIPLVVRLEGTNVEQGRKMLEESDVELIRGDDMNDAAKKIVEAVANA
ncbi:MAG: ADP-forming succinate--CoA ligase subunit beta [Deltaproteobacteria bacterium]|nr:ADP-forming succinate--CoA ligase subunit beta [Deltaproteobacteria bacterium]MBU48273.1 ADP-forming succinate--CoA ligase subunit beta [Deltaproteobacteria bacterium]